MNVKQIQLEIVDKLESGYGLYIEHDPSYYGHLNIGSIFSDFVNLELTHDVSTNKVIIKSDISGDDFVDSKEVNSALKEFEGEESPFDELMYSDEDGFTFLREIPMDEYEYSKLKECIDYLNESEFVLRLRRIVK